MNLKTRSERFLLSAFIGLTLVAVSPTREAEAQRRRQAKSVTTLTVNASLYYEVGGFQPVPPTTFIILDEEPDTLLSLLGEAPTISYAVAKVSGESLEIARLRIQIAQASDGYMREQLEGLLRMTRGVERSKATSAFNRNERYVPDKDIMLRASARLLNQTLTSTVTNDHGVAILRGIPAGQKVYLLGIASTRGGGVAVWSFSATLKRGANETLNLNQSNALLAF